jgi:hypothetical protein
MQFNLLAAIVWFVAGTGMLVLSWLHPEKAPWTIRGTDLSAGWLGIVLAVYNLARYFSIRASRRPDGEATLRQRRPRSPSEGSSREPDPNFQFDDQSEADGSKRRRSEND